MKSLRSKIIVISLLSALAGGSAHAGTWGDTLEHMECVMDAKKAALQALEECSAAYAAASWSKAPFARVSGLAALKFIWCRSAVDDQFEADTQSCDTQFGVSSDMPL